jgi:hypothetical protein
MNVFSFLDNKNFLLGESDPERCAFLAEMRKQEDSPMINSRMLLKREYYANIGIQLFDPKLKYPHFGHSTPQILV